MTSNNLCEQIDSSTYMQTLIATPDYIEIWNENFYSDDKVLHKLFTFFIHSWFERKG